jgi:GH24 family phage-related lysozyme (muramidase)
MIKLKDILNEQVSSDITSAAKSAATTAVSTNNKKDFTLPNNVASQKLWDHIRKYESLRTFTYDDAVYPSVKFKGKKADSVGTLTIGYGHTGDDVYPGQTITKQEADKYLRDDVNNAADCVKRWIKRQKIRDSKNNTNYHLLTQGMYDVMIDIVFNRGCSWFINSKILSNIEAGSYDKAKQLISNLSGDRDRWTEASAMFVY